MQPVVIVGGGVSGLSAAYFLRKFAGEAIGKAGGEEGTRSLRNLPIQLVEERDRLGGVILTERVNGFLLEGGPDSFLAQKPAAIELCRALGLSNDLIPSNDYQRKTYILQGGKLKELPDGLMFLVPTKLWPVFRSNLFSLSGKLRMAMAPFQHIPRVRGDVSVAEYISQRLGQQVLERLAEPLITAVYGADVNSLSAGAVLQRFMTLEEKHGNLWRAVRQSRAAPAGKDPQRPASIFVTLRNGVGQLVKQLERALATAEVVTGKEVKRICRASSGNGWRVQLDGAELEASAVILATPAHSAAEMINDFDPKLAEKLREIPYHSSVTVSLGFEEGSFSRPLDGFGFVVARGERKRMIACTWVGAKFPFRCPSGRLLVRCFLGGARDPAVITEDESSILQCVLAELREIMGLRSDPLFHRIHRWERAMPQYNVGHSGRVQEITALLSGHPGLFLSGNAYQGVGISDCIDSSALAAGEALRYLQSIR